jgi:hypothetical protein
MISSKKYLALTLIAAVFIGALFPILNYVGKEGFNPSDDGVILAQSWRILNGEVPHKDFISLRPVFSGILHTIHFYGPLALEESARWFVVFQNFLISFLWVFLLLRAFNTGSSYDISGKWGFISISIIAFTMNLNHHGLFPWTTVDALFWGVIGSAFFISMYRETESLLRKSVMGALGIFFLSLAGLSRQTFIFVVIFLDLLVILRYLKLKKYLHLAGILLIGQIPIIIYLIYLLRHDALSLFISQMVGHTELFEVGIMRYIKSFLKARLLLLNLPILIYLLWYVFKNLRSLTNAGTDNLNFLKEKFPGLLALLATLWLVICLSLSVNTLIINDPMNQANPFELFFIMLDILLFAFILLPLNARQKFILATGLILCWTASLSSGSNSPVYCLGIVVSLVIILSLYLVSLIKSEITEKISDKTKILLVPAGILIFTLGIWMQAKINYRDKSSAELDCKIGKLFPSMGHILTNSNLCNYYNEFLNIYNNIPSMKDHFVLLPNNAIIYPVLKSRNPFPIDWPQHDEYIGQESFLLDKIRQVLQQKEIFILVDKFNVENIAFRLNAVDYFNSSANPENDLFLKRFKNRLKKYDFMPLISEYCQEVPSDYRFFRLYVTRAK